MGQDRRHAIVIGSGIGGLVATRVLTDHFDQVSMLDRDEFPSAPDHRPGAPQSRHLHGLQPRGAAILYELFPRLYEELLADGATPVDGFDRVKIVTPAGRLPLTGRTEKPALFFSRFHLEWRLRERLEADDRVLLCPGTKVVGLSTEAVGGSATGNEVRGVRVRRRGRHGFADADRDEVIDADLVVDAGGRSSRAAEWLDELGHGSAMEETLSSELSYASRFYARPEGFPDDFSLVIVNGRPPDIPRSGLVQDIENGQWHVTLGGLAGLAVPTDEEGFRQWAAGLADPSVHEAIRVARPLTPIRGWRTPTSRWRHFERMPSWPTGLVVLGDAVCALNPIYGQGMTVAAMEGIVLRDCLREGAGARQAGFERTFQRRLARTVAGPWLVASSEDLRWPSVHLSGARPPRGLRVLRAYLDRVLHAAVRDQVLAERYFAVVAMTALPRSLFAPRVIARLIRHALSRAIPPRDGAREPDRFALSPESLAVVRAMPSALPAADESIVDEPVVDGPIADEPISDDHSARPVAATTTD